MKNHSIVSKKTLSILVIGDDPTSINIVAGLLKKWEYEVATITRPSDALSLLDTKRNSFDFVIVEEHMRAMNSFELKQVIDQEFKLPVVLMSPDDDEGVVLKGLEGEEYFIVKPLSTDALNNLWQFASRRKNELATEEISVTNCREKNFKISESNGKNLVHEMLTGDKDEEMDKSSESPDGDGAKTKKQKVTWTPALHNKFLEAIRMIGFERAVPKTILEAMKEPGLTRENVASHLQKYRIFLKRVADESYEIEFSPGSSLLDSSNIGSKFPLQNPSWMLNKLGSKQQNWPYSSEICTKNLPILDTSSDSFHILEASSFNAIPLSGLPPSHSLSNQGGSNQVPQTLTQETPKSLDINQNSVYDATMLGFWNSNCAISRNSTSSSYDFMQDSYGVNVNDYVGSGNGDEYPPKTVEMGSSNGSNVNNYVGYKIGDENLNKFVGMGSSNGYNCLKNESSMSTDPKSTTENGIGEDDFVLNYEDMTSIWETFFSEETNVKDDNGHGDYDISLQSQNQVFSGKEVQEFGSFETKDAEADAVPGKRFSKEDHSIDEATIFKFSGNNNQYSNDCFFGDDQACYPVDDEDLLESMLSPGNLEEDMTLQGLF